MTFKRAFGKGPRTVGSQLERTDWSTTRLGFHDVSIRSVPVRAAASLDDLCKLAKQAGLVIIAAKTPELAQIKVLDDARILPLEVQRV